MDIDRRHFNRAAVASLMAVLGGAARGAHGAAETPSGATKESADQHHLEAMQRHAHLGAGPKLKIGMLVYPGMFLMDLVGPLSVFEALMNRDIHLLWKDKQPVANEKPEHPGLIPVPPTTTFVDCPRDLDVLFVPGGVPGTLTMMEDDVVLDFLAERGKTAHYITSVCTGSLILGAAGLLKGYRAASYWATRDVLRELGAIPSKQRVVTDRNRITGGGVTAGIDFGLTLAAKLRNPTYAKAIQLYLEYSPAPPYNAGSPETAPKEAVAFMNDMFAGLKDATRTTAQRTVKKRLRG
jgi:cyclohexyl-isocyanide hydratase